MLYALVEYSTIIDANQTSSYQISMSRREEWRVGAGGWLPRAVLPLADTSGARARARRVLARRRGQLCGSGHHGALAQARPSHPRRLWADRLTDLLRQALDGLGDSRAVGGRKRDRGQQRGGACATGRDLVRRRALKALAKALRWWAQARARSVEAGGGEGLRTE